MLTDVTLWETTTVQHLVQTLQKELEELTDIIVSNTRMWLFSVHYA